MDNDPKETKQLTTGEEGDNRSFIEKVKETGGSLKERAKEEAKEYKDPQDTQLWKSIFRVSHDRSDPRNRSLAILSNVFLHLHPAKINRDAVRYPFTWGMGGITFYLFIVLTFTGVLLMFYYHPTKLDAFRDILYLEHDVPFGKLLRNMHRWAAHLMVITTWLHMFRVVLTGSYKRPREFNWCVGVVLLVLTLLLSFTGYLLPDDQLGFWAVTVGTNMARATPMLGNEGPFGAQLGLTPYNDVRFGLLGGSIVDANALLRAYIWHCIGIPLVASIFMAVHFWRIRKDGGISGPAPVMLDCGCERFTACVYLALHRHTFGRVNIYGGAFLADQKRRWHFRTRAGDARLWMRTLYCVRISGTASAYLWSRQYLWRCIFGGSEKTVAFPDPRR